MKREDLDCLVLWRFELGCPCSQIDKDMGLAEGYAHDTIIKWWRRMRKE